MRGKWLVKLLSKDESGVSFGHVACLFVILYVAVMAAVLAFTAKEVPHTLLDIPSGWVYVVGILWGSQKASEAYSAKKGASDGAN